MTSKAGEIVWWITAPALIKKWRQVLDYVAGVPEQIHFESMQGLDMDGYPAAELAKLFFNWVCDLLPQKLYNRRLQLSGREFGNGFEWY